VELYKLKDQVQESVDYAEGNPDKEVFSLTEVSKDMLICPSHQSIPEKYFKTLDCDIATTTRRSYLIGITTGDIVMTYIGPKRKEIKDFVVDYAAKQSTTKDKKMALRDELGNKSLVYAPISGGIEVAIYGSNKLNVGNDKLNDAVNTQKKDCGVSLDSLVEAIEKEFGVKHQTELPSDAKYEHVYNNRGILISCMTGHQIFESKKKDKTFRIRCPMVFDKIQNANVPKTSLMGFGCLNNTTIKDGYYEGDLTIFYQDDEFDEAINSLTEKGGVEWLDGQQ